MEAPVFVLVGTGHPGNAGAAARAAANFGVVDLRFVAPRCDVKDDVALERAVHARSLLESATVQPTLEAALAGTSWSVGTTARTSPAPNHFLRKPLDVREWAEGASTVEGTMAVVFGREDTGLTREEVNRLDQLITIPTADYASLNLSHAVSLVAWELFRVRAARVSPERALAPDTLAALHKAWDALIDETEERPWRREVAYGIWRKVLGRAPPDDHEVHNLMGILTRALKRFGHPDYTKPKVRTMLKARGLLVDEEE